MENLVHIGARIAHFRDAKGISQSELARHLGITPQAVQKWEAGISDPRFNKLDAIADAVGTTVEQLLEGTQFFGHTRKIKQVSTSLEGGRRLRELRLEGVVEVPDEDSWSSKHTMESIDEHEIDRRRRQQILKMRPRAMDELGVRRPYPLPLISWVQAGDFTETINIFAPGYAEDWIPCPFGHGPNAFVLKVVGESMFDPTGPKSYAPGEYIAVDPAREPQNRSMVVVRVDHEDRATFKQYMTDEDGAVMLKALNPNWPNRIFPIPEGSRIVGVVIGKWVPE